MLKGNVIYFGYGTVSVGVGSYYIKFTEIYPPQIVGENYTEEVRYLREITIYYSNDKDFKKFLIDLENVSQMDNKRIKIQDRFLDFNNYHEGSVEVVRDAINKIYDEMVKDQKAVDRLNKAMKRHWIRR